MLAEEERLAREALEEQEYLANQAIDPETGELLAEPADSSAEAISSKEPEAFFEPEILAYDSHPAADEPEAFGDEEESVPEVPLTGASAMAGEALLSDDEDLSVEVDFTPKTNLLYKLPTIELFAADKPKNQSKEKYLVRQNIKVLEDTFRSFGIDVKVERAEIGPSVTKYEVKPAVGVRVNRISNLADDLALALAAKDVRIEAPIPGKSLVGIEVPNFRGCNSFFPRALGAIQHL